MNKLANSIVALALLSPCAYSLNLNPSINSTIVVNACKYKRTNSIFDMALINRGYFVMQRGARGPFFYTRYGHFKINDKDEVINFAGGRLMGSTEVEPYRFRLEPIKIPTDMLKPKATSKANLTLNLSAYTQPKESVQTAMSIYDTLGQQHVLTTIYTKSTSYAWQVSIVIDDQVISGSEIIFNKDGSANSESSVKKISWTSPQGIQNITLDLSELTQFFSPYGLTKSSQDGYSLANLSNINITADGEIILQYSNYQSVKFDKRVAIATFEAPEKLTEVIENFYIPNA
ncbi:MAG: flagellar hook-basal body complex protein, partial [Legionella sp.]